MNFYKNTYLLIAGTAVAALPDLWTRVEQGDQGSGQVNEDYGRVIWTQLFSRTISLV